MECASEKGSCLYNRIFGYACAFWNGGYSRVYYQAQQEASLDSSVHTLSIEYQAVRKSLFTQGLF